MTRPSHSHDHGLIHDLGVMHRRRMLSLIGAGGAGMLLAGPGQAASAPAAACSALPSETNGPFPSDGSNSSGGRLSNLLSESGVVRSDIRSSFGGLTGTATGVRLDLTIRLGNLGQACAPLAGRAIYIWACDAQGRYSIYESPTQNYLRGVQTTDSRGEARFTTIFPGAYPGRYPHIHFEVFPSLESARSYRTSSLISQFVLPEDVCATVYAGDAYRGSRRNFSGASPQRDGVFGDNSPAQIAAMTPRIVGEPKNGLKADVAVGLSA